MPRTRNPRFTLLLALLTGGCYGTYAEVDLGSHAPVPVETDTSIYVEPPCEPDPGCPYEYHEYGPGYELHEYSY